MNKQRKSEPGIGIDIGRVIMAPVVGGRADTSFLSGGLEKALATPPSPGAFDGVRSLVSAFAGRAWLISKAGPKVQHKTKQWLRHWDFYDETGLPRSHLRFCLQRSQKALHCRQLRLTHFIDDRLDVLEHLRDLVPNLYLFGEQPDLDEIPDWVNPTTDWREATETVLEQLARDHH
ncbi:MAG: hypothetical protein QNJ30_04255 [Kiloniellales bacterium]|nr:hypothetical protein [Kiloniellales bacterium]